MMRESQIIQNNKNAEIVELLDRVNRYLDRQGTC